MNAIQVRVRSLGACSDGMMWARDFNDPMDAWRACPRGDWLLWLAGKLGIQRETLVLASCACARFALPYMQDVRSLLAIKMAERLAKGSNPRPSLKQVQNALRAADDATDDATATADDAIATARCAAYYAIRAADARCAADTAYHACYVVYYASRVVSDDAYAAIAKCAALVREHIDEATILTLWRHHGAAAHG